MRRDDGTALCNRCVCYITRISLRLGKDLGTTECKQDLGCWSLAACASATPRSKTFNSAVSLTRWAARLCAVVRSTNPSPRTQKTGVTVSCCTRRNQADRPRSMTSSRTATDAIVRGECP